MTFRANAAEWTKGVCMWSFECRNYSPYDLLDTAEKWRRCSVASHPTKSANTKAHFVPVRHSRSVFQR